MAIARDTPSRDRDRSRPTKKLGGALDFMRLLWEINHGFDSASKMMAKTVGVTGPQRLVVRMIGRFPDISAGQLAEILHSDPSTLTGVLRRLETRRLIVRRTDVKDARRRRFRLTREGVRINRLRALTIEGSVERALGRVAARDTVAAARLLDHLAAELSRPSNGRPRARRQGRGR